ncbi:universal stress protein [Candidatus Poribacteria bacterium]|nr:universal stress protein [Candidatus Poribacteria bacterium]
MLPMTDRNARILLVASLIAGITLFHYGTPGHLMYLHVLLQALFFAPVSLSGWWFGKKGGLAAASAISLVYMYHAVTVMMATAEMAVSNGIQILLLFAVGFFTGTYADIRRSYYQTLSDAKPLPAASFSTEQNLLVHLDESEISMNAVRYVARLFGRSPEVRVTLLYVANNPNPELFASAEEQQSQRARLSDTAASVLGKAKEYLFQNGFEESRLETCLEEGQNTRVSDVILAHQKSHGHTAIVTGRHRFSRTEEFLFGSTALRLARQATCPVWVIDETGVSAAATQANQT